MLRDIHTPIRYITADQFFADFLIGAVLFAIAVWIFLKFFKPHLRRASRLELSSGEKSDPDEQPRARRRKGPRNSL
jgi:hypothetical protein